MKHLPSAASDRLCVRVVLPSGAIRKHDEAEFLNGLARLEKHGFEVRFDLQRMQARWRDYYAGDDAERASEFINALTEPDVDIVWFGRGGAGCARILPTVLENAAQFAPRAIVGFSDATALLNAFAVRLGWLTFHGPVVKSLDRADLNLLRTTLRGGANHVAFQGRPLGAPETLVGQLYGGNLMTLCSLVGTPSCPPSEGTIWLLEEVGEYDYRVDRALRHLRDAGCFDGAIGAFLGPVFRGAPEPERVQFELGIPCFTGAPAGHHGPMRLLPIGGRVRLEAHQLTGLHPWVHLDRQAVHG